MVDRTQQLLGLRALHNDPLDRLIAADELAQRLRVLTRQLAAEAHDAGHSWEEIGRALGVSRATAHERFSDGNTRATGRRRRSR